MSTKKKVGPTAISLFSGGGGFDLGIENAGFSVRLCIEIDPVCRDTLSTARSGWRIADTGDIHELAPDAALSQAGIGRGELALLAGGPPCQPFSKASYWVRGETGRIGDRRADTLNAYLEYVRFALPEALILENVRGMAYKGKDEGIQVLRRGLLKINRAEGTQYDPVVFHLNAASYGVPQLRERTFVIAHRSGHKITFPAPTHVDIESAPNIEDKGMARFATAWDAIGDLAGQLADDKSLEASGKWAGLLPSVPEGENYLWHTSRRGGQPLFGWRTRYWSFLLKLAKNRPSWTISAQPGPATGPFHWENRRLSVRELARLQTFPDNYMFAGSYRDAQRQIGNAVPPALGELLGLEIRKQLFGERAAERPLHLIPSLRNDCPPAEPAQRVPRRYFSLKGSHADHPGAGRGPGAKKRTKVPTT